MPTALNIFLRGNKDKNLSDSDGGWYIRMNVINGMVLLGRTFIRAVAIYITSSNYIVVKYMKTNNYSRQKLFLFELSCNDILSGTCM